MKVKVKLGYIPPIEHGYYVYYKGKRLSKFKKYDLEESGELQIIERSVLLSPFWWFYAIFRLVLILTCSDDYFYDAYILKTVSINYSGIKDSILQITMTEGIGREFFGASSHYFTETTKVLYPKLKRRSKAVDIMTWILPALILVGIIVLIIFEV